jgi:hypothetical protein
MADNQPDISTDSVTNDENNNEFMRVTAAHQILIEGK